jgi:streptogramin lyase
MNAFLSVSRRRARSRATRHPTHDSRPSLEALEQRCLLAVSLQQFPAPPVFALAPGPDGNVWFTEPNKIGRITPTGAISEFVIPGGDQNPGDIAAASDGNLWFQTSPPGTWTTIGGITPQGAIALYNNGAGPPPHGSSSAVIALAAGSDGNIYFATQTTITVEFVTRTTYAIEKLILPAPPSFSPVQDMNTTSITDMATAPGGGVWYITSTNLIGRLVNNTVEEFPLPNPNSRPTSMTTGPDGNGWFTETIAGTTTFKIGRITLQGVVTEFAVPISATSITTGPDGNLWFTDPYASRIGSMTLAGVVKEYRLPWQTNPGAIITGPDGALWFRTAQGIGRMSIVALTPSQAFVSQAYRDLLGREADPVGLAGWSVMIDQGTARSDVVRAIEVSPEYQGVVVQQLYATYLRRSADPVGLASGEAFLAGGGTREVLAAMLLGSAEYYQSQGGGTDAGFLSALYLDALNRSIDPTSLATGEQALAAGVGRDQLALAVLSSDEHRIVVVDLMYQNYLSRMPGLGEQQGWVQFLNGNQTDPQLDAAAVAGFVGSDEYMAGV